MLPSALSSASYGIQQYMQQFATAADRITDPDTAAGVKEIMAMKQAELGVKVNASVIRAVNDMSYSAINILV